MSEPRSTRWSILALPGLSAPLVPSDVMGTGPAGAVAHSVEALKIDKYTLNNGLEVILVEDHSAPTVAVSVWYKVGGADDPQNRSGFAHLFEHMMFQGSAHVPPGRHSMLVNNAGGEDNASTSIDRTNYFDLLAAHQLPLALWLEADRMSSLVVDDANFKREREVVKEEYRQRIGNQPYGEAFLKLQTVPYDYVPYQRPTIGSIADLNAATIDDVRAFHASFYKPNNASLTVAGDIDVARTKELIDGFFGPIARQSPAPLLPEYRFAPQTQPTVETMRDPLARVPAAFIAYRVPPRGEPDYYAAVLLARVLGEGDSSRLAQALVDTGLASNAGAYTMGNVGPSVTYVSLIPNPGVDLQKLEEIYYAELERIRRDGVDAAELSKAINQIRTQRVRSLQTSLGMAESVQSANFYLGDPRALFAELDRFRAVTSADVKRVVEEYFGQERRNVVTVLPDPAAARPPAATAPVAASTEVTETAGTVTVSDAAPGPTTPQAVTETIGGAQPGGESAPAASAPLGGSDAATPVVPVEAPPTPLRVRAFSLPPITETRMTNGLQVIVVEMPKLPLLLARLSFPGGESEAPARLDGLAQFAADLLPRGTTSRTAQDIAGAIEQVGGDLQTSADNDKLTVTVSALEEYADLAFDLLSDVALHPTFPEQEVDIERQRMLTSLQAALAEPAEVADRAYNAIVFGAHPYGRSMTEASLKAIGRADVSEFYAAQRNPNGAILVIAGDVTPETALKQAERVFAGWTSAEPPTARQFEAPPARTSRRVYLVDRLGSTQAQLQMGNLGASGNSSERYALQVANQVLGAGATSRLFRNLREQRGYTYGVYSGFSFPRHRGKFVVRAAVRNEVIQAAIEQVLLEMERMQTEDVPVDELRNAKAYLVGSYALRLETLDALTAQLVDLWMRGLPVDALRAYPEWIDKADEREVRRVAQEFIRPGESGIVVVGDAGKIQASLEQVAPVTLVDAEGRSQ